MCTVALWLLLLLRMLLLTMRLLLLAVPSLLLHTSRRG